MPSEDAKTAATATQSVKDEDEDGMSLGSILKDRKNKALNASLASSSKPRPKEVKVQKEEAGGSNDGSDKKKPLKSGSVSASGPGSRVVKVKKAEKVEEDDDDDKPISRKLASVKLDKEVNVKKKVKQENIKTVKVELKRKKSTGGSKQETPKKREKKVYDLPGQKRDPPEERDPLRIFYESLHKQIPRSEMAQFWMMESGLLPREEAKKAFDKKQRKSQAQKLSSPAKSAVSVQRSSQTMSIKKKDLSSSLSSKKKTADVKVLSKQPKRRKDEDRSSGNDSDDDFVISRTKKPRTAN
ncbi:protein IWS1 homolog A [Rhodamnia argentea]|uniref:Protein IWS1 homolog A n=1 Tax=Rhodamnia argentea TaxID=178133 RepID=A0A8B8NXT8_9MYRT|nr:protein IWS1 homolog A [Rhodamnia argentea]XP_048130080.1 protein IWS1 homolog A [Rhodamnia argentea]